MNSNPVLRITLLVSFLIHLGILLQNPNFNPIVRMKQEQKIEVSYLKALKMAKEIKPETAARREPLLKLPERISVEKKLPPPLYLAEDKKMPPPFVDKQSIPFSKPAFLKPDSPALKKKITLPPSESEKSNNPVYISYYQIVREKIKRAAYQNYTGKEEGEVNISFVILKDGSLQELRLVEEKSNSSAYLREMALKSIKEASVFPPFPAELDYPQLSFNLSITFEVE